MICDSADMVRMKESRLSCVNEARLEISKAILLVSTPEMCPMQYKKEEKPPNCGLDGKNGIDLTKQVHLL